MKRFKMLSLALIVVLLCLFTALLCACTDTSVDSPVKDGDSTHVSGDDSHISDDNISSPEFFDYSLNADKQSYTIVSYNEIENSVTIPSTYNGLPVVAIGSHAFERCSWINTLTIPASITSIESDAFGDTFHGCSNLTRINYTGDLKGWCNISGLSNLMARVARNRKLFINNKEIAGDLVIPDGVTCIDGAFYGLRRLKSVTIPDSVTSIEFGAFMDCTGLTSITIPDSVTSIGNEVFSGCSGLTSITIPDSVTSIGNWAFSGCRGLTSVTLGNNITSISDHAFEYCCGLTSITIPDSVTSIGDHAFNGCSGLTSITIGSGVTFTMPWSFDNCFRLVEVYNKSKLNIVAESGSYGGVGRYAKNVYSTEGGSKLTTDENGFVIYDGNTLVNYIGEDSVITIPNTITNINQYALYYCRDLTSVSIPDSVTSIEFGAFMGCTSLTCITISDSVTSIGESAFDGCSGLPNITIPNSVTSIGESAFSGCSGLTSITIPDSVTSIGYSAFSGCSSLCFNEYENALYLGNDKNPYVVLVNAKDKNITSCKINSNTKVIYRYAFYNCSELTSVTIPNNVTSIGNSAFYGCENLSSVTFMNTSGWYVTQDESATSGKSISVTDSSQNAEYLTDTYDNYYWKRIG